MIWSYLSPPLKETTSLKGPEKSGEDRNISACVISGKFTDLMRHISILEVANTMFQAYLKGVNFIPKYIQVRLFPTLYCS